jgi:hypothetical protein
LECESHGIWYFGGGLAGRQVRMIPKPLCDFLFQAIRAFEHMVQADQVTVLIVCLDTAHRWKDHSSAFVVDVGAGLGGFHVLAGS